MFDENSFRRRPNKASVHSARYDWNEIFCKASPHALFADISHVIQMTLSNDDIMLMFPSTRTRQLSHNNCVNGRKVLPSCANGQVLLQKCALSVSQRRTETAACG